MPKSILRALAALPLDVPSDTMQPPTLQPISRQSAANRAEIHFTSLSRLAVGRSIGHDAAAAPAINQPRTAPKSTLQALTAVPLEVPSDTMQPPTVQPISRRPYNQSAANLAEIRFATLSRRAAGSSIRHDAAPTVPKSFLRALAAVPLEVQSDTMQPRTVPPISRRPRRNLFYEP